jgi:hypothetical protein
MATKAEEHRKVLIVLNYMRNIMEQRYLKELYRTIIYIAYFIAVQLKWGGGGFIN